MESFCGANRCAHDHPSQSAWQTDIGVQKSPEQPSHQSANGTADQTSCSTVKAPDDAAICAARQSEPAPYCAADAGCCHGCRDDGPEAHRRGRFAERAKVADGTFQKDPGDKSGPTAKNCTIVNEAIERHVGTAQSRSRFHLFYKPYPIVEEICTSRLSSVGRNRADLLEHSLQHVIQIADASQGFLYWKLATSPNPDRLEGMGK